MTGESKVTIRAEQPGDVEQVREVVTRAFSQSELGHHGEGQLVDRLRQSCPEAVSRVAELAGEVVGHILLTPVVIEAEDRLWYGMGLAPMAVSPELQSRGVGSQLVEAGLAALRAADQPFVVVLGHPEYYPRFGFEPASRYGIKSEYGPEADEVFMILGLTSEPEALGAGVARYRPEFGGD